MTPGRSVDAAAKAGLRFARDQTLGEEIANAVTHGIRVPPGWRWQGLA